MEERMRIENIEKSGENVRRITLREILRKWIVKVAQDRVP
jgi:hypothetical protein